MSFTTQVKEEILNLDSADKNELSAIIKMSGSLGLADKKLSLSIITENAKIARHIYALLERLYRINPEIKYHHKTNLRKNRVYTVFLDDNVEQILADLQLSDSFFGIETGIEQQILSDDNAGRSYLKGAFLSTGSIRDPESGKYQLEIFSVYFFKFKIFYGLFYQFGHRLNCFLNVLFQVYRIHVQSVVSNVLQSHRGSIPDVFLV